MQIKKICIAGSREFSDYALLRTVVDALIEKEFSGLEIEIVSGNARGADKLGEQYAKERGFTLKLFPAEWELIGKSAGIVRNFSMAVYSDHLVAFWDGNSRGTANMIKVSKKSCDGVDVFDFNGKQTFRLRHNRWKPA